MHYFAAVLIPAGGDVEELVTAAMEPYYEGEYEDGWWDWWVIGGRWTGVWSEHDPHEDPANWETCWLCGGTGLRNDDAGRLHRAANPQYDCNGCGLRRADDPPTARPLGMKLKHPSDWARCEGDVVTVAQYRNCAAVREPFAVVTPKAVEMHEVWNGEGFDKTENWREVLMAAVDGFEDHRVVVVDYHS